MDKFIWEMQDFPNFKYDTSNLHIIIEQVVEKIANLKAILLQLQENQEQEILIELMSDEAIKTSAIEGNYFSREDIMSSIRNNLGLNTLPILIRDKGARDIANLMIKVREDYTIPLSLELIKSWHIILMKSEPINLGAWRSSQEPMQVISGNFSEIEIHYQAPPSSQVQTLMEEFIVWYTAFNISEKGNYINAVVKSALAHLYFETIHPFEDGNGRIGRAIAEKCLAESLGFPLFLSLSTVIEKSKTLYYEALKKGQRNLEVTAWIIYFAKVINQALSNAQQIVHFTLLRSKFFDKYKNSLNERQEKALRKMFKSFNEPFEGGMTAKKYMSITKASKATATRDLQVLLDLGCFNILGAGRSVRYELNFNL